MGLWVLIGLYFGYMTIRDDIRNEMERKARQSKIKKNLAKHHSVEKTNRTLGGSTSVTFFRKDVLCQLKKSV